jgi:hypothetical protein
MAAPVPEIMDTTSYAITLKWRKIVKNVIYICSLFEYCLRALNHHGDEYKFHNILRLLTAMLGARPLCYMAFAAS